jgi:hypothetical protein
MTPSPKDRSSATRKSGGSIDNESFIPQQYQHPAAIALILLGLLVFFYPVVFEGKTFTGADSIASKSFWTMRDDAEEQGIFRLWNPYIFCGMPSYGSLTFSELRYKWFDFTAAVIDAPLEFIEKNIPDPLFWQSFLFYLIFAVSMYFYMWRKLGSKVPALIASLAATYSMYIIIWPMEGHHTKMPVMAFFPIIFYAVERLKEEWDIRFALVLVFAIHFILLPSHVQMIFYTYLALGVYGLFLVVRALRKKESWKGIVRVAAVLVVATGLAVAMMADRILSVLEYNPYSIRGMNPITETTETKTKEGGLDYEYATNWSFSPGEVATFAIPSWYGFGVHPYQGPLSNNQVMKVNTYFGPQPFTHAPQYMGVVVLMLAIVGFVRSRKDPFVQYLGIMAVFSLLVSFGREFSLVYDLMFRYFPMFNKFRIPSMILVLVQIFVPMLAAYGVASFLRARGTTMSPASEKRWKYALGGLAGVFVITLILPSVVRGAYGMFFSPEAVTRKFTNLPAQYATEIYNFVANAVVADILIGALLLLAAFGAIFLYLRRSLSIATLTAVLVLAVVADLWRVAYKPMDANERQEEERLFATPEYVRFLQQDTTKFRVLEFINGQPPYNNMLAFWRIESAYGYHGAKMRWYQDMVDVVNLRNPLLWGLMNVKYVITNQPDSVGPLSLVYNGADRKVYYNTASLPRAFFVNRYEVAEPREILEKMRTLSFDPRDVAYVVEDPKVAVEPPHPSAKAEITRYGIQDLELRVTTAGTNLLFLSEAYYPVGWNAYLNGNPVDIHRVNYMFRGVVVPAGVHTLEMRFEPRGFAVGKRLSLITNLLVLVVGVVVYGPALASWWRKKRDQEPAAS